MPLGALVGWLVGMHPRVHVNQIPKRQQIQPSAPHECWFDQCAWTEKFGKKSVAGKKRRRRMVCFLLSSIKLNKTTILIVVVVVCVCVCMVMASVMVREPRTRHGLEPSWTPCVWLSNDPVWLGCDCDYWCLSLSQCVLVLMFYLENSNITK